MIENHTDGVLLINKPKGPTSFDVVARIRRMTDAKKVGHAGTLDPLASGLLIVLVGPATKKQAEFMGLDKEYLAEITFGRETETYDAEGKIIGENREASEKLTGDKVTEALKLFEGEIAQTVPAYSAVKVKGKKLYNLSRQGHIGSIILPHRIVTIYKIDLLQFIKSTPLDLPRAVIKVTCSKGTYIRSLASDLGKKLGCGAYLSELTRTRIGPYSLDSSLSIEEFTQSFRTSDSEVRNLASA